MRPLDRFVTFRWLLAAAAVPTSAWVAVTAALPTAAEGRGALPHELASTWRTRVAVAPGSILSRRGPISVAATSLTTGSLPPAAAPLSLLEGIASFYWQGQKTASGEPFDKSALTAAHKTLPFNTRVRVTHMRNGRSVVVRINDRGPFTPGRIIDLSDAAADIIGMKSHGLARVRLEVLP